MCKFKIDKITYSKRSLEQYKISAFVSLYCIFNLKNYYCNVSLNIMMKRWKYSMANILNYCRIFYKFGSNRKNYWEAFNFFSVLMDCSNKENLKKVIKEAISPMCKKKNFSHVTEKSVLLKRNPLKALVIMSLFLLFLLLFLLIAFISLASWSFSKWAFSHLFNITI